MQYPPFQYPRSNGEAAGEGAVDGAVAGAGGMPPSASLPPLISVLLRRWRTVALTVFACLCCGVLYLATAERVYRTAATVYVTPVGPKVFRDDGGGYGPRSEGFLGSQASILRSTPVLTRAVQELGHNSMQTFAEAADDPVAWLQRGDRVEVGVGNKADLLTVTMESPYPREAVEIVNAIVRGYVEEQAARRRSQGSEAVRVLRAQRDELQMRLDEAQREILRHHAERGVLSFRTNDNGNTVLQRAAALAEAVTAAEMANGQLRAQRDALTAALASPAAAEALVDALQFRSPDGGDREYDELRSQLVQHQLAISSNVMGQGRNHPQARVVAARIDNLKSQIDAKQRSMINAQLVATNTELTAGAERESQLRAALREQHDQALGMNPGARRVAALEADVTQMRRHCEVLDARIAEVSANSLAGGPLNVEVVEWARSGASPVKPRKGLTLLAAVVGSWVLAAGLALVREWRDRRLYTPAEVSPLFGTPVLAEIPTLNRQLSPAVRGRIVHLDARSPAAGAYRAIRTHLTLGAAGRAARTIVVASPTPGDGKSTTASNLAIAFANAGSRTLLIDCDLVRPVQHRIFETECEAGLSSVWSGEAALRDVICPTAVHNLHLLPCGPTPAHPSDMLTSKRFALLLRVLLGAFDRIIIDSPPLATVSDGNVLAAVADGTLLVLRMNHSHLDYTAAAMEGLRRCGANVLGVVANDVPNRRGYRRYSYPQVGLGGDFADTQLVLRKRRATNNGEARAMPQLQQDVFAGIEEPDWTAAELSSPPRDPGDRNQGG